MVNRKIVITDRKMNAALFKIGEIWLEYLAHISDDSPLKAFLEKKGEGFHHIAYQVDSIKEARTQLPKGALLLSRNSNVGEWMVADIDPKFGFGINAQLIEE